MAVDDLGVDDLDEVAMTDARLWIGLRFRWEVTEAGKGKPYKFEKDGEMMTGTSKDKNYPVKFLGKDSASVPASTNGSGTATVDSLSVLTDIHNPVVEAKIQELAKTLPHGEWFKASYALLGANGVAAASVPDLVAAMGGRGLYESLGGKG